MKNRKLISAFAACIMIALLILPAGTALAAGDVSTHMKVDAANMTLMDNKGAAIAPDGSGNYADVPKDAKASIQFRFSLKDDNGLDRSDPAYEEYNYVAGDYIEVQLPYAVNFAAPSGGWNVMTDVPSGETPEIMGTLSIGPSGLARITFTDYVATHSSIKAWFNLEGTFKDEVFNVGDPVNVTVEFAGHMTNIHFESDPVSISSEKNGVYDPSSNTITWTFKATSDRTLSAVTLVDTYSKNQTYVAGSFKKGGAAVNDADLTIDTSGTNATITYTTGLVKDTAATFTYQTTPASTAFEAETGTNENVTFTNRIDVNFEGENKARSDANVTINWIQKTGAVAGTSATDSRIINWTVTANSGGYSIHNAVITDTLPAGLSLIEGDSAHPIQLGGSTIPPTSYTYAVGTVPGTHVLTVNAGDLTASRVLTFSTQVTDPTVYQHNGTTGYTNSVQLGWTENASGTPTDTSTVNVGIGVLSKAAGSRVNYNNTTTNVINWTVRVNQNCIPITGAVFTDVIPPSTSGMEYVAGSFKIDGTTIVPNYDSGSGTLTYSFGDITTTYTITFQTRITDITKLYNNTTVSFNNSVTLTGTGITDGTVTATGTQQYNSQMLAKSVAVAYNHITRRVTWQLYVNRNKVPLPANTLITETIPAGMTLLPETFDVLGETGESIASTSTVYPVTDLTHNDSFTYALPEGSTTIYTIQFQTQVKEGALLTQGTKSFTNSAGLTGTGLNVTATANVSFNNSMVTKTLAHLTGADYISWAVFMNREAVPLDGIEVSDTLQSGLAVDIDSVALYPMTLAADGTLTKGTAPVPKSQYTVTYNTATRELKFTMPGVHTQPYELDFITDVLTSPLTVNNTVTMRGDSYTATGLITQTEIQVSESGLGGTGVQGSITVEKTDEHDKPLAGAEFTLYDNRGNAVKHDKTDKDGRIVFGSLPIRTYVLEETAPPPGYLITAAPVRIRMGTATPDVFYKFEDNLIYGSIKIVKTNTGGTPLVGAVYGLYKADDTDFSDPVARGTSTADGSILFENVPYGDYVIREISAPVGYTVSPQAVAVAVRDDGKLVTTSPAAVQDDNIKGSIRLVKFAEDGTTPLAGAVYGLYAASDTAFASPVAQATSGADGVVLFQNIKYGDYVIREISAPVGYTVSSQAIAVSIREDGKLVTTTPASVRDESIKGSIRILKFAENGKTPLAGAVFGLYAAADTAFASPVAQSTSGADGVVLFQNIKYGDYVIREISAPKGYTVSTVTVAVQIRNDGETVNAGTFTNSKKPPEGSPKTGDDIWLYAIIFGASVVGIALTALIGRSRKAKRESSR